MKRYLLDSNVLIHVVNKAAGHGSIEGRLLSARADTVLVSAVTVWEIFRMAEKGKVPSRASRAALDLLNEFKAVPLTREAAALGGSIHSRTPTCCCSTTGE